MPFRPLTRCYEVESRGVNPRGSIRLDVFRFTCCGLTSDVAYTLSDIYVQRIDSCRTVGEIASVNHIMYEDYIRRVNRCRMSSGRSRPVQACCDYIDTHIAENLSVEFLAKRAGYADYYFSRLFKKETGISIKEYIRQTRLKEAKILLDSTQMSIQEISEHLRFCSRSYFADQFQKSISFRSCSMPSRKRLSDH